MRASVMFKLAIAGLITAAISMGFLFAGDPQAKPFAVLGTLLGFGAVASGAIANWFGALVDDLKDEKKRK